MEINNSSLNMLLKSVRHSSNELKSQTVILITVAINSSPSGIIIAVVLELLKLSYIRNYP